MDLNSMFPTLKSLILIGLTSGFFSAIISTGCDLLITKINNKNTSKATSKNYLFLMWEIYSNKKPSK